MSEVTSNWISLSDSFYDKVELYSGVFSGVSSSSLVSSGQYGGPVLVLDQGVLTVFTSSGEQISQWRWNNARPVTAGWSEVQEAVFVLEDGTVLIYSMFGIFQSSFSMGQEAKDIKILSAQIYPSQVGTGVTVLTTTQRFYSVSSLTEPRLRKLYDCGEVSSWCPVCSDKAGRLVVGRGGQLLLLSVNDMSVLELDLPPGKVVSVATSHSQTKLCAVMDSGLVWTGTLNRVLATLQLDTVPSAAVWVGEEAVLLVSSTSTVMLHTSGQTWQLFQPSPLCLVQECDGVRIISHGFHDLVHKVDTSLVEIYRIASMSPGSILLLASQALANKSHKADEYIRMIQDRLTVAVAQCISAAGSLFHHHHHHQKELMRAAKFGMAFLKSGSSSDNFYQQCSTLKLLNCLRHYKVGIPLSSVQLSSLTNQVVLDRLIARRLFPLALEISDHLKLPAGEGRSRVLGHWAIYKVETSRLEEADTAREVSSRLGPCPHISYSHVAEKAAEVGKKQLAVLLLEHEVRADRQVPLLLKLGQGAPALRKAIYSGDTDLIYHVILTLQEQHSPADFHMIIRQDPVGSKLYSLYCSHHSQAGLADWLQQEDDFSSMARISFSDSYSMARLETRLAHLVTAMEKFKRGRDDFQASVTDENYRLLKYQSGLEEKFGKVFLNLSLHQTLRKLLEERETKLADKMRSEFKVNDRKYFWLKVRAFGESRQWTELYSLVKNKRSPIGFGPFIDQCLKAGESGQASKYLPFLTPEEKLRYSVKLGLYQVSPQPRLICFLLIKMFQEAAEVAFALRNMEALTALEVKANKNISLLETIAAYKQRLESPR